MRVLRELNGRPLPRVTKPMEKGTSHPRVQLETESNGLSVVLPSRREIVTSTSSAFDARAHGGPNTITQESINGAMEKTKCNISPRQD